MVAESKYDFRELGAYREMSDQVTAMSRTAIAKGQAHHMAGRLREAEAIYRQVLAADANNPDALHLLGMIAHQRGDNELVVELIGKAIAANPRVPAYHNNLGNALQEQGLLEEAVATYRRALALRPDYVEAHNNLGNALRDQGLLEEAVAAYHRSLALRPGYAEAHNNLGNALKELGKLDEAVERYHKALAIAPEYVEAHYNLGIALLNLGKLDEAAASCHKALALKPDHAAAHSTLGNVLRDQGKLDAAVASYHKALAIAPDYAEAHRCLAHVKQCSEYDDDLKAMENTYAMPGLSDEQRMHLAFGLGKSFEDLGQYEKAFGFYLKGNAIKRATIEFSIENAEKYFATVKKLFAESLFSKHQGAGSPDETPIFILGMPRSGTTLVEQILASHPKVHGAGEVDYISRIVASNFGRIDDAKFTGNINQASNGGFSRAGGEYIGMIRARDDSAAFITDKMPDNFLFIGLIKLMLPKAKIIHCHRDPPDTCLSLFKNLFTTNSCHYAYDLELLGQYYNLYRDLMAHWHDVLPGFIYDIQYEDVVADQATQSRALLAYCGLEWDEACLDFHRTDRPIQTASSAQVRRPMYTNSVRSWLRYEEQLAPLLEIL